MEKIEYYTQIGTGNYNEKTARLYTDLSLMTYDQEIGEAAAIFRACYGRNGSGVKTSGSAKLSSEPIT